MSRITAANYVNTHLVPSSFLLRGVFWGYTTVALLVLFTGVWPLEIKTLLIAFLGRELQRCRCYIFAMTGDFSLHIDGHCYWRNSECHVEHVIFQSPLGFILEVGDVHNVKRIPLMFDAFPAKDFRHISRICLELKG